MKVEPAGSVIADDGTDRARTEVLAVGVGLAGLEEVGVGEAVGKAVAVGAGETTGADETEGLAETTGVGVGEGVETGATASGASNDQPKCLPKSPSPVCIESPWSRFRYKLDTDAREAEF